MGGTAFLIHGNLSESTVQKALRVGLFARLLGKNALQVANYGEGRELITLPPRNLTGLVDSFLSYMYGLLPKPWPASAQELDYLKMASTIYLRGERKGQETDWYVQYSLSGCAGMAEVSAELGYHWLSKWYAAESSSINQQFLAPFGFVPTHADVDAGERLFVPIAECGYAGFSSRGTATGADQSEEALFEVDVAAEETFGENTEVAMRQLEEVCGVHRRAAKCCCQVCRPNLDLSYSARLTHFL
jgi:hypothetical protein